MGLIFNTITTTVVSDEHKDGALHCTSVSYCCEWLFAVRPAICLYKLKCQQPRSATCSRRGAAW